MKKGGTNVKGSLPFKINNVIKLYVDLDTGEQIGLFNYEKNYRTIQIKRNARKLTNGKYIVELVYQCRRNESKQANLFD